MTNAIRKRLGPLSVVATIAVIGALAAFIALAAMPDSVSAQTPPPPPPPPSGGTGGGGGGAHHHHHRLPPARERSRRVARPTPTSLKAPVLSISRPTRSLTTCWW